MEMIKKNTTLIVGIAIPILMILFVAASIYLPGFFIQPKYDFLYASGDDYYYSQYQYSVQNGKLTRHEVEKSDRYPQREVKLYIHDVTKNESREISFAEAQNLTLDSNIKSPDGFEIVYGSRAGGFFPFFFWPDVNYNTCYLKGHNLSKKLNLRLNGSYYRGFRFLGWLIK